MSEPTKEQIAEAIRTIYEYNGSGYTQRGLCDAAMVLVNAQKAEHPADDAEPIGNDEGTREFLRGLGFVPRTHQLVLGPLAGDADRKIVTGHDDNFALWMFVDTNNEGISYLKPPRTRRDVRDLVRVLGGEGA